MGYSEVGLPAIRRELPGPDIVVIIDIGPPIRVTESGDERRWSRHGAGFVAGLDDGFSLTAHDGRQAGIQLRLTPLGARVFCRVRLSEISRQVISLPDLLPAHRSVAERLASTPSWGDRFAIVEDLLTKELGSGRTSASAAWATTAIERAGGRVDVATLSGALGYSRKHLAALFHEHVGLPPKLYASLVRFDRLVRGLKLGPPVLWATLAAVHGYADQAHLSREVRRFAGVTPTELVDLLGATRWVLGPS